MKILVLFSQKSKWISVSDAINCQLRIWQKMKQINDIQIINIDKESHVKIIKEAFSAQLICLMSLSPSIVKFLRYFRETLSMHIPFLIYLYGNASRGCFFYHLFGLDKILNSRDCFIASSEADARAMKLSYENALVRVIPFYINSYTQQKIIKQKRSVTSFVYAGRISEQKISMERYRRYPF